MFITHIFYKSAYRYHFKVLKIPMIGDIPRQGEKSSEWICRYIWPTQGKRQTETSLRIFLKQNRHLWGYFWDQKVHLWRKKESADIFHQLRVSQEASIISQASKIEENSFLPLVKTNSLNILFQRMEKTRIWC